MNLCLFAFHKSLHHLNVVNLILFTFFIKFHKVSVYYSFEKSGTSSAQSDQLFETAFKSNMFFLFLLYFLLLKFRAVITLCLLCDGTFSVQLQHPQQAHGFEHLCYEHLQAALQLDEEPTDLRVDLSVLWTAARRGGGGGGGVRGRQGGRKTERKRHKSDREGECVQSG